MLIFPWRSRVANFAPEALLIVIVLSSTAKRKTPCHQPPQQCYGVPLRQSYRSPWRTLDFGIWIGYIFALLWGWQTSRQGSHHRSCCSVHHSNVCRIQVQYHHILFKLTFHTACASCAEIAFSGNRRDGRKCSVVLFFIECESVVSRNKRITSLVGMFWPFCQNSIGGIYATWSPERFSKFFSLVHPIRISFRICWRAKIVFICPFVSSSTKGHQGHSIRVFQPPMKYFRDR